MRMVIDIYMGREIIMKLLKKKRFWFCAVILIGLLYFLYSRSQYTFVEQNKIINYALQGNHWDFSLSCVEYEMSNNTYWYQVYKTSKVETDQFMYICKRMNEYLKNNKNYFLNDGYKINLVFVVHKSGGPGIVTFTNWYTDSESDKTIVKEELNCMQIRGEPKYDGFDLNNIKDSSLYDCIEYINVEARYGDYRNINELRNLKQIKSLKEVKINYKISQEDFKILKDDLKENLPKCKLTLEGDE